MSGTFLDKFKIPIINYFIS